MFVYDWTKLLINTSFQIAVINNKLLPVSVIVLSIFVTQYLKGLQNGIIKASLTGTVIIVASDFLVTHSL